MTHPAWDRACDALHAGDHDALRALLAAHPELATATDDDGGTLLDLLLAWPGHRPGAAVSARLVVEAGYPVEALGTPLSAAVCTEESDVVRALLELGADPRAVNGWRPDRVVDLVAEMAEDLTREDHPARAELVAAFEEATDETLPRRPALAAPSPVLPVADVRASVAWYREVLGFGEPELFPDEEAPRYAILTRGGTSVHLDQVPVERAGTAGFVVRTDRPADLLAELTGAGAELRQPLTEQPWGWTDFVVADPDGNALRFGGPTE